MAHAITTTAGKAEMAFVGETPWHGLGQRLTKGAPLETWIRESGMAWRAEQAPVQFTTTAGALVTMPEKKVLYRSDTGAALSVVGEGYNVVQPLEVFEFFRDMTEAGGWHIHTAGTLNGGRRLWAMASNHTEGEIAAGDKVRGNLLLATSLDGTLKTHAVMTAIRVVCANTLRLAMRDAVQGGKSGRKLAADEQHTGRGVIVKGQRGNASAVAVSHRSEFNAEAVKSELGVARDAFARFMDEARTLAEKPVSADDARDLLRDLIGGPSKVRGKSAEVVTPATVMPQGIATANADFLALLAKDAQGDKMREHRNVQRIMDLYTGAGMGAHHVASRGTAWGLLNAVTQFVDHEAGRNQNNRVDSAWFGRGDQLKQDAFAALLAM